MKKVSFKNQKGQLLRGFVHEPKKYDSAFIVLHGFPGSCTSKRIVSTCKLLEKKGFLVLRFDFSCTNLSEGKFEDKLMSQEAREIKYAIDFLKKNYKFSKLILYGHSTGATDASLYAYKDKRINKMILSGATDDLKSSVHFDFNDEMVYNFWTKGFVRYNLKGKWTYRKKINKPFYDEFFKLSIPKAMKKYKRPLLIVHGEKDEDVPVSKAYKLFDLANKPKKLFIIKDCDHKFSKLIWLKKFIDEATKFAND